MNGNRLPRGVSLRYGVFAAVFNGLRVFLMAAILAMTGSAALAADGPLKLLVLGDSLAAGYGLPEKDAFPVRLEQALRKGGLDIRVINGGVSGDTTAGGASRLDWSLADRPDLAIVELGGNDALRGLDPKGTYRNLDRILSRLKTAGIGVLLAGMYAPPNWGREYTKEFNDIYPDLARRYAVMLYPFFLEGVASRRAFNQRDGIHPNAKGVMEIVNRIAPYVVRLARQHRRD